MRDCDRKRERKLEERVCVWCVCNVYVCDVCVC